MVKMLIKGNLIHLTPGPVTSALRPVYYKSTIRAAADCMQCKNIVQLVLEVVGIITRISQK